MVIVKNRFWQAQAKDEESMLIKRVHKFDSLSRTKSGHGRQSKNGNEVVKRREMRELEEMFSELKPMALHPSLDTTAAATNSAHSHGFTTKNGNNKASQIKKKNVYDPRMKNRTTSRAQRDDVIRTVYVSDIDHQITEEQLAALFFSCGEVMDCRVCGDPYSILHFAFVEFADEEAARAALTLSGTVVGHYPVKVMPSKTAIAPVNPTFLPQTLDEHEVCSRTVYVTNIDNKVFEADVKLFFQTFCGEVRRLRLLGDRRHSSRIAFVEFAVAESAVAALNCSGVILGLHPIRVSPSKTPIRSRYRRRPPSRSYYYT